MRHSVLTGWLLLRVLVGVVLAAGLRGPTTTLAETKSYPVMAPDGTIVGQVSMTDDTSPAMTGSFTSTYGGPPPSLQAAAQKCGENHFNWFQIVTSDTDPSGNYPPPPYIDPPPGGYSNQWADHLPWYYDEGPDPPDPKPPTWEDGFNIEDNMWDLNKDGSIETLGFYDRPRGPIGTVVDFTTYLVSVNADGSIHSFHSGFQWQYYHVYVTGGASEGDADGTEVEVAHLGTLVPGGTGYQWASLLGLVPGDANLDGIVDAQDAAIVAGHWGMCDPSFETITWREGDFNFDSVVNAADASIMAANWTMSTPPGGEGASVPEPTVLELLVVLGIVPWIRRRGRQRRANGRLQSL
jgi:hypothetical protein